ncbi:MAG: LLM class flavin-dependent oxidoreductase [Chloroflexi bacterium]|nr:LLM class flavin-dependent oxidoreductase [Chloroflexota bacterium]
MINQFGTIFAGHVDLENIGLAGTAVNDRLYSNEYLLTTFSKAEAIAKLMDEVGYDTLWLAEHHFQREGYECIPNILMLGVHLAHLTKRLKFGSAFNVTTMWHPLRLAEDFAMADVLTGGRIIFGVGRGYHTREVEVMGAPLLDGDANRELFEEQVEIIFKAFNEPSFSHHGKHYDIPAKVPYRGYELEEITLVPRPLHLPVECWQPIVSASPRGMNFMAKHGIKGVIGGGVAQGGASDTVVKAWRDTLAAHGRETELGGDLLMGFAFHIAETREKAMAEARDFYYEDMKMFAPLNMRRGITPEQIELLSDPAKAPFADLPRIEEDSAQGRWLCGPPEHIIERLMEVQEMYPGLERVNVGTAIGTPQDVILEQLEWFGKEVMPAFKGQVQAPVEQAAS